MSIWKKAFLENERGFLRCRRVFHRTRAPDGDKKRKRLPLSFRLSGNFFRPAALFDHVFSRLQHDLDGLISRLSPFDGDDDERPDDGIQKEEESARRAERDADDLQNVFRR